MNKWLKALLFLAGAAFLTRLIPFSSWFRILDTMIHELGHAAMTLLMSGRVLSIELNPDHSGVTYSMLASGGWSPIVVSLAGYTSASLFAILMFYGYAKEKTGYRPDHHYRASPHHDHLLRSRRLRIMVAYHIYDRKSDLLFPRR